MQLRIKGLASGISTSLSYDSRDLSLDLLSFLRKNSITISSSCDGEGVCKKCSIQNGWLTCQLTLEEFIQCQPDGNIYISYL